MNDCGQNIADHHVDTAQQRWVLQLLVAEPDQSLEPADLSQRYLEPKFRDRAICIRVDSKGFEYVEIDGRKSPFLCGRDWFEAMFERFPRMHLKDPEVRPKYRGTYYAGSNLFRRRSRWHNS
jgi:hypothetical protein